MFELLTAKQTYDTDAKTIAAGTPGIALMEAAGLAVVEDIKRRFATPSPVLVLCGPGNNGGDGFVVARQLDKAGWQVRVACPVLPSELKGDAALAAQKWAKPVEVLNARTSIDDTGLVVDAVFGIGFSKSLPASVAALFKHIRDKKIPVVAVDIPSGMSGDTGLCDPDTLQAKVTVTFTRKKIGHTLMPGRARCGHITVASIGVQDQTVWDTSVTTFENDIALWLANFPLPSLTDHKYSRGRCVIAGGADMTGAARLAALACARVGAGMTVIAAPKKAELIYKTGSPSLVVETADTPDAFKKILTRKKTNAALIGPGAGLSDDLKKKVFAVLETCGTAVLDADALSVFAGDPQKLFKKLKPTHILTPHEGEFERLFGKSKTDKLTRTRLAAKKANTIIVFKGSDTVIAAPDGTAVINTNAPATLATAGSGDVLAGLITGLGAQGMPPFMAACAGVWLHGEAAKNQGLGLIAEDIISLIPQVLNQLFGLPALNA